MIKLLLRLPVALVLAVGIAWILTMVLSRDPDALVGGAYADLARAIPEPGAREKILAEALALPPAAGRFFRALEDRGATLARAGILVSQLHAAIMLRLLLLFALAGTTGLSGGLALRERMRDEEGYASPSAAGLGRFLVGAGVFWAGLFSMSPLPVSCASLYASGVLLAGGSLLWSANLPLKL